MRVVVVVSCDVIFFLSRKRKKTGIFFRGHPMKKIFFAPKPATEVKIFFSSDDPEKKILLYIGK